MNHNPWNLTPRECEVLCAIAATGRPKTAAAELGIARQTVGEFTQRAKKKMDETTIIGAVVKFDRWARAQ